MDSPSGAFLKNRWSHLVAVVVAASMAVACAPSPGSSSVATSVVPATTAAPILSSVPLIPSGHAVPFRAEDVFVRGCDSQVYGNDVSLDPDDRLGPLVLFLLSEEAPRFDAEFLAPNDAGELSIQKYVTQLEGDRAVWLEIAEEDRAHASLIYDPGRWTGNQDGRLPLDAGDSVVRFDACGNTSGYSQYNGGILVDGPRCVILRVWADEEPAPLAVVPVQFGQELDCT